MNKLITAAAAALVLALSFVAAPSIASASTIGATTSQTQTSTYGNLTSNDTLTQLSNGTMYQVASSGSSSGPETCVNKCTGSSSGQTYLSSKTNFSTAETTNTYFQGVQSSYNITCAVSAYSTPF